MTSKKIKHQSKTAKYVIYSATTPLADPGNIQEIRRQFSEFMFDIWQASRKKNPWSNPRIQLFGLQYMFYRVSRVATPPGIVIGLEWYDKYGIAWSHQQPHGICEMLVQTKRVQHVTVTMNRKKHNDKVFEAVIKDIYKHRTLPNKWTVGWLLFFVQTARFQVFVSRFQKRKRTFIYRVLYYPAL